MTAKASPKETLKKNKGGRPRKNGSGTRGSTSITWKRISQPVSTHHYEVSSMGGVRRLLKTGQYYDLKPWVTGGPYAAVYLTGIKGATRGRKKCYVHKLVADHFVPGKASNKVVHHTVGPHSNTKNTLQWVTPSENNNARKFFTDDGKRKVKKARPPKKTIEKLHTSAAPQKTAPTPKEKPPKPEPKPKVQKPKPQPKNSPPAPKPKPKPAPKPKPQPKYSLPNDPDEYYEEETWDEKLGWLLKNHPPLKKAWTRFLKTMKGVVKRKNFKKKFREATGKSLKLGDHPSAWNTRMISAMYEIERRLEVD